MWKSDDFVLGKDSSHGLGGYKNEIDSLCLETFHLVIIVQFIYILIKFLKLYFLKHLNKYNNTKII